MFLSPFIIWISSFFTRRFYHFFIFITIEMRVDKYIDLLQSSLKVEDIWKKI